MQYFCSIVFVAAGLAGFLCLNVGTALGAAGSGATQSQAGGGVTVKATYLNPAGADEPQFSVVLDTHSVNLDPYDFKAISALRDDKGKSYQPSKTEGKGSGHHREATLTFPKISPEAGALELVIKDVAGVKERVFRWDLK